MVKTLQKSSPPKPAGRFPRHLVCSIGVSSPSYFVQMMTLERPDLFYGKVKFCNLGFSMKKVKTVDFSETFAASDLKASRSSHLFEYMKVCEY